MQTNAAQPPSDASVTPQTSATQTVTTVVTLPPQGAATAREMYEAMRLRRNVIEDQLSQAKSDRYEIASRLREGNVSGADKEGLEQRLSLADVRIISLEHQLASAQDQEAQASAVPGAQTRTAAEEREDTLEVIGAIGGSLLFVMAIPLSIAWARRIWKRHAVTIELTPEFSRRLDAIERGVEATAIEVERIGEGQRFVTQLLAQRDEAARVALPVERSK